MSSARELVRAVPQNLTLQVVALSDWKSSELLIYHNGRAFSGNPRIIFERRLLIGSFTYLGWVEDLGRLPWAVWSRVGFIGCMFSVKIDRTPMQSAHHPYMYGREGGVMLGSCLVKDECTGKCAPAAKGVCTVVPSDTRNFSGSAVCDCSLTHTSPITCEGALQHLNFKLTFTLATHSGSLTMIIRFRLQIRFVSLCSILLTQIRLEF